MEKNATNTAAPGVLAPRLPLSVYMITFNNNATIGKALQSVSGWAEEVIVVDSHSTDGAIDTIQRYTDKLYQFDTKDQREKYQSAQNLCSNPWVLFIDADEWLTEEFKNEVAGIISGDTRYSGFIAHRRNIYLGRDDQAWRMVS